MGKIAVEVEKLGKRYKIGQFQPYKALRDSIAAAFRAPVSRVRSILGRSDKEDDSVDSFIWALKDVSFAVEAGEVLGIIGKNGSGKSTLLKILSRIVEPTEGCAKIRGRVGSLLEVGTGFHPELTGRENIYLNGAILGMRKDEITRKFDEIVSFAEVEKFIDTPVKHYSSGMHVRLGFAVAAHLEPEILLVDEVLAVGDAAFQRKCLGKIGEVAREGRTVLFVSHNMAAVRSLCERTILLERGQILMDGDPSEVVNAYLSAAAASDSEGQIIWSDEADAPGGEMLKLMAIKLVDFTGSVSHVFDIEKPIRVEVVYSVKQLLKGLRIILRLMTSQGEIAFQSSDESSRETLVEPGLYTSICTIPENLLNTGEYLVRVAARIPGGKALLSGREYLKFRTVRSANQENFRSSAWPGVVHPKLEWKTQRIN